MKEVKESLSMLKRQLDVENLPMDRLREALNAFLDASGNEQEESLLSAVEEAGRCAGYLIKF